MVRTFRKRGEDGKGLLVQFKLDRFFGTRHNCLYSNTAGGRGNQHVKSQLPQTSQNFRMSFHRDRQFMTRCVHCPLFMTSLERSHAELRAALIMAGRHIRKLNFGRKDDPVLKKLREVLREARRTAKGDGKEQ